MRHRVLQSSINQAEGQHPDLLQARRGARSDPDHHDVHGGMDEHGMMWHDEHHMDSLHHYDDALHGHAYGDHMDWTHEHLADLHGMEHDAMHAVDHQGSFDMSLHPTEYGTLHMEHELQDVHLPADHLQLTDAIKESDKAGVEAAEAAIKMGLPSKKVAEVAFQAAKAVAEAEGMCLG